MIWKIKAEIWGVCFKVVENLRVSTDFMINDWVVQWQKRLWCFIWTCGGILIDWNFYYETYWSDDNLEKLGEDRKDFVYFWVR